jgi:hypothetical protein
MSAPSKTEQTDEFLAVLEESVKKVLANRKATSSERMAAVNAGLKLIAIKYKIEGNEDKGFFE